MQPKLRARLSHERLEQILLVLILAFLGAMMLRNVDAPLLDRHSWRQTDTASFARGLAVGQFDVLHPRFLAYYPDAYGIEGAVETEFNLYPLIVAGLFRVFGPHDSLARLVSIGFALGSAVWVYLLGKAYLDRTAALVASASLGLSPLYVFYSRSVQPEATVLFLSLGALYLFGRWMDDGRWPVYVGAVIMAALAFLTKIPSLHIALPLLAIAWEKRGPGLFRDWRLWLFCVAALLPAVVYYVHAHGLYQESGMTVYGISGGWPGSGKFDAMGQLLSPEFYRVMLSRLRGVILGRFGSLLFVLGLVLVPAKPKERMLYAWLAAFGLFVVAVAQGNRQHEYYQLPLVPVGSLFIGKACSALLRPGALRLDALLVRERLGMLMVAVCLLLGLRGAIRTLEPMYAQASTLLDVAAAARDLTPADAPVAILHDWARVPEVFYYSQRRGWSLWLERTPEGEYGRLIVAERQRTSSGWQVVEKLEDGIGRLEVLRAQGAGALVVSLEKGTSEEFDRGAVGAALALRYPTIGRSEHWLVYDLR